MSRLLSMQNVRLILVEASSVRPSLNLHFLDLLPGHIGLLENRRGNLHIRPIHELPFEVELFEGASSGQLADHIPALIVRRRHLELICEGNHLLISFGTERMLTVLSCFVGAAVCCLVLEQASCFVVRLHVGSG